MRSRLRLAIATFGLALGLALPALAGDADAVRRGIGSAKNDIEQRAWERAEQSLRYVGQYMDGLDPAVKADFDKQIAELRNQIKLGLQIQKYDEVEDRLKKIEEVVSGKESEYWDSTRRRFQLLDESLKECPPDDQRTKDYQARAAKAKAAFDAIVAKGERDEVCNGPIKYWKETLSKQGEGDSEKEKGPAPFEQWKKQYCTLEMPQTERRYGATSQWLEDNAKTALAKYPNDPELKAVADEVKKARADAQAKIVAAAKSVLDQAEKAEKTEDAKNNIQRLGEEVKRYGSGSPEVGAVVGRCEALVKKWEAEWAAAKGAHEDLEKEMTAAAEEAWKGILKEYSSAVEIDPLEAVQNIGAWKGKLVKFNQCANRAGWEYDSGDYAVVTPVHGSAVALQFDPEVSKTAEQIAEKTGVRYDSNDYHDIVAEVVGICRVNTQEYWQIDQRWHSTGYQQAPLCKIIAFHVGPYAIARGGGTMLDKMKNAPKVEGVSGGGGWGGGGGGGWGARLSAWLLSILALVGGLVAAAPGAQHLVPAVKGPLEKLGKNLTFAGLGFAAIGLLWLFGTAVYGDFLPALLLVAAGTITGIDWVVSTGNVTPEEAAKLRPFGLYAGVGAAVFGVLHLFLWSVPLL